MSLPVTPPANDFAHLHLHSVYSLLDGAIRINDLVKEVKAQGMSSVAITDHGNMFGTLDFYDAAVKEGIKPIIGCEFYVAPGSRYEKKNVDRIADGNAFHLVLLAKNKTGYKNMIKMASRAYTEGFYRKPRIDYDLLSEHSEGIVGLTACLAGEVNRLLYQDEHRHAANLAGQLQETLGKDNFFLEVQNHGIPEQLQVAQGAIKLSQQNNIPLVLTNDAHFLHKKDQKAQEIMLRIQMNKQIDDPLEFGFNEEFYVKNPSEMAQLYPDHPEAFLNTLRIAEMCDLQFDFGDPLLPDFQTPGNLSLATYLNNQANEGLRKRFNGNQVPEKYQKRLEYELSVINGMRFEGYFLIVADFIDFARKAGIPVGPGRGSAAGSLVAFSLGITNLDPLQYDLLFERFLNPARNEMPDIDIDFCRDRREEVIQYVIDKYGEDHVSQIITFNTLSAKAVIKDVARVLGFNYADINALSKHLPDTPGISLEEAVKASPEVQDWLEQGEQEKLLFEVSKVLEGVPRNAGKHAAGVVIAPEPLEHIIPLAKDNKTDSVISQFEKGPLEKVGLVKMDFLGLKNLTIIDNCIAEIHKSEPDFDIEKIPLNDPRPYELLQKGLTKGIFQVESSGITRLLTRAKPAKFEDIVACIALYRPGPLESGMTEEYIQRRNGELAISYPHKDLEPILKDTLGTLVYQEQIMLISQVIGGFSMAEADTLRKAMGKKKADVMAKMKDLFLEGAVKQDYKADWAGNLFDMMAEFAKYGFNKSHSAAYGLITYQTAYLKAIYPTQFMKATLDADIETTDKLIGFIFSCREMGIKILPPHVNESSQYFTITGESTIRYGLLGLKGVGMAAVDALVSERNENGPFRDVFDFVSRIIPQNLNRRLLESLIYSGAFDSLNPSRSALFASVDQLLNFGTKAQQDKAIGQESLFGEDIAPEATLQLDSVPEWEQHEQLKYEKETLGLFLSDHPMSKYADVLRHTNVTALKDIDDGVSSERRVTIMGIIEGWKTINTRRGTSFLSLSISDLTDRMELRIYNNLYNQQKDQIFEGNILLIETKAMVYRDGDQPTILLTALKLIPADSLQSMVQKSLHLRIEAPKGNPMQKIQELKSILRSYPGKHPVYLHYRDEDNQQRVLKAHSSFFVDYNEGLTRALSENTSKPGDIAWQIGDKLHVGQETIELHSKAG